MRKNLRPDMSISRVRQSRTYGELQLGLAQGVHVIDFSLVLEVRILAANFESRREAVVFDGERFEGDDESLDTLEAMNCNVKGQHEDLT